MLAGRFFSIVIRISMELFVICIRSRLLLPTSSGHVLLSCSLLLLSLRSHCCVVGCPLGRVSLLVILRNPMLLAKRSTGSSSVHDTGGVLLLDDALDPLLHLIASFRGTTDCNHAVGFAR